MRSHPSLPARTAILVLGFFLLLPVTVLAQATTGAFTGKVTDASSGDPMIAVNVVVCDTEGRPTRFGGFTNSEGVYQIINVPPGTYSIRFAFVGYDATEIPNVTIAAGQTLTGDMALNKSTTGLIMGQVTDHSTGTVLAGVKMALMDVLGNQVLLEETTGSDGRYRFTRVPPGRYNLRAILDGYRTMEVQMLLVSAGEVTRMNFSLEPQGR
jgi:5-hydroxyisourate hydrolase-like protein (transthyretin family)